MGTLGKAIYTVGFWVRETGQALDRLGSRLQGNYYFQEQCMSVHLYMCLLNICFFSLYVVSRIMNKDPFFSTYLPAFIILLLW